jgi:FkbM family methyltransferase
MYLTRLRAARALNVPFTRAASFVLPRSLRLNGEKIALQLPSEHGVRGTFVEVLLDDCYQLHRIAWMSSPIRHVIDIGANVGLFGVAARTAFLHAVIHAYEPNTALQPFLAHQSRMAGFEYFLEAVGRQAGRVRLEVNGSESVHTSSHLDPAGTIPQIALRDAIERIGGNVDLLKVDCEGAEWEMLEDIQAWTAVRFVTMEYHLRYGQDRLAIQTALERCGFRLISQRPIQSYGLVLARRER